VKPDDNELIERVCESDPVALEILHQRYETAVRGRLCRIVRDQFIIDDLVQETFLRVWTKAYQFHRSRSFEAWLMRIATNLALNHLRLLKRRRESPLDRPINAMTSGEEETGIATWLVDESTPAQDKITEQDEEKAMLWNLVDCLPPGKREAVRAVYEAELNISEAAAALAIPEGTIKSRLHYAMETLASDLSRLAKLSEETK
jgi:RNA polymerase sigma-70 factor, ECF subfamily